MADLKHSNKKTCKHCGARFGKEEATNYCGKGKFVVPRLNSLPEGVYDVYAGRRFRKRERGYNSNFSFAALGASPDPTWAQPPYPSMLKLHEKPYNRVMDASRGSYEGSATNNSRMYIFDNEL